jgi:Tfp pilus assembly protein PilF
MRTENAGNSARRLNTWKEIASFFGRDVRTVKRWEVNRDLPVRRLPNGTRSPVYAYEHELKAWLDEGGATPARTTTVPRLQAGQAFTAMVCAAMIACLAILQSDSGPVGRSGIAAPPRHVPNADASAFYRDGLYEWQTRTPIGLKHAVDDFEQAIIHDPHYAEAYVGLANCYNLLREFSTMPPGEAFPRAKAAAEQAIALDPSLGDAHAALAFDDFYWSRDSAGARHEFERAIALEPHNATTHHWYATFLAAVGDYPHALAQIDIARGLDSESTAILADKGLILVASGKREEGIGLLERLEQTEPTFYSSHRYLADIYLGQGNNAGFLRELAAAASARHDDSESAIAEAGVRGLAANGREGMLRSMLGAQKELYADGKQSAYALALTYAKLNDIGNATAYLKLSLIGHESEDATLAEDSTFKRLRMALRDMARKAGGPPS